MDSQPAQDLHQVISSVAINRENLSPADRFVALDLSVKLMALVCTADGTLHDAEIELSRQVYEAHAGDVISHGTIRHAIRRQSSVSRATTRPARTTGTTCCWATASRTWTRAPRRRILRHPSRNLTLWKTCRSHQTEN